MSRQQLLIGGVWTDPVTKNFEEVKSPFDQSVVGEVAVASPADVDLAFSKAAIGAQIWRRTPAHQRFAILVKAAEIADSRIEMMAQLISSENGKAIGEARGEAARSGEIIRLSAYEGAQLYGSTLPLDANNGTGQEKLGFTLRQPVGIVVAISPFNYPALLVLHKVAPALASGNAVILKPARSTPLTALALAQCFLDAGLPEGVLSVITGSGSELGNALVSDKRARKISFTGSTTTGEYITSVAGIKKLSLELGASCPVIILKDADLELAATAIALGGFVNAGQVCISVQRVIVDASILADFLSLLTPKIQAITTGNPLSPDTKMGTLINQTEARRVKTCIDQAVNEGAKLLMGSDLEGTVMQPAVLTDVNPYSAIAQDELFGPAIAISEANSTAEAIELANSTNYGLGSGVFTKDISAAIQSAREIDSGIIDINWTPLWRADLMPYGGLKSSGIGKEGVRSAVTEMTEEKTIVLHGTPWGDKK